MVVTLLAVVLLYLASTWGLSAWHRAQADPSAASGSIPLVVEPPPDSVATTRDYGPLGTVSMVFAGTEVREGLLGSLDDPWIGVSATDGSYRAFSVPGLPTAAPGAVAVTPAGDLLAWATQSGVMLYDTVSGETREVSLPGASEVGAFSPDGSRLLVSAGELDVVDVASGDVVARLDAGPGSAHRAVWRPDGSAIDLLADGRLLTADVPGDSWSAQPLDLPDRASLAWSPSGDRLVAMQEVAGAQRLLLAHLRPDGSLSAPQRVPDTEGVSMDRLIGFSGPRTVTVVAYFLESGALQRVIDISLDSGAPTDLTTLPDRGENWAGTGTLAVATESLAYGSTDFGERVWPWSYPTRLVACLLAGLFGLGLWLTRRPRR